LDRKTELRELLKIQTEIRDSLVNEIGKNIVELAKLEGLV
jgi:hypothetical protein